MTIGQAEERYDVLCLGIMVADVVALPVSGLPPKGTLATVERMELHTGGCAVNTGISLARLGLRTAVMGKVGQDGFGDYVIGVLKGHGIDVRGVVRDSHHNTSGTMVMVDRDGERTFIHYVGANGAVREEDVDYDLVRRARILHIAGHNLMPGFDGEVAGRVLQRARAAGVLTSLDTAWDFSGRWLQLIAPCLGHLDLFVPSIEEARQIAGREEPADVAAFFLDRGIRTVALKMGSQGCYVRTREEEVRLPAYPVNAIDATGAGDAFAGGFLAGVALGWDLARTARLANAVGALCVTAVGATAGVRSLEETIAFMEQYG
ncbi:MAG: sugar kinase [Anaerolineae bacterium]|nr:sugar kinase [Anaerolineae bacterium]